MVCPIPQTAGRTLPAYPFPLAGRLSVSLHTLVHGRLTLGVKRQILGFRAHQAVCVALMNRNSTFQRATRFTNRTPVYRDPMFVFVCGARVCFRVCARRTLRPPRWVSTGPVVVRLAEMAN